MADTMHRKGDLSPDAIAIDETSRLVSSDKVQGTEVYNPDGENIGSIYNFMVDKLTGRVEYAVMSFGGFLGIGERYYPLPWQTLKYDTELGGFVVNVDKQMLEQAPNYAVDETPWSDPAYGRGVHGYYGIPYYL
ncbi:PRC-barrel domain-containing protein [Leptospira interrogans]